MVLTETGIEALGRRVLAVVAHPDDESFGLGAVVHALLGEGVSVSALCFTAGERSTLGAEHLDLAAVRRQELEAAARVLGLEGVTLLDYPDGRLSEVPLDDLARHIVPAAIEADALLVFDCGGVTGHPDHVRATDAALLAADRLDLPVYGWAIDAGVAAWLNAELGTLFTGIEPQPADIALRVDREGQWRAIACHESQATNNPVLRRRLDLQGDREWLRLLRARG